MFSLFRREKPPARAPGQPLQPIFIVGQYKCGSTWLLSILAAHPQVIGVDELNLVDAAGVMVEGKVVLAPVEQRLAGFFERNAWSQATVGEKQADLHALVAAGEPLPYRPWDRNEYQKIIDLPPGAATELHRRLQEAGSLTGAMDAFLQTISGAAKEETHVAFKASNQIPQMGILKEWQPEAKYVVCLRDGRDAALSGYHYEKRMKENNPYGWGGHDYWSLLEYWRQQASLAAEQARAGNLYIVRYEDLWHQLVPTLEALFTWLGLESSRKVIKKIDKLTCFEAKTGRPRGVAENSFRRKGMAGEWVGELSPEDKEKAWALAGAELERFGYTRVGALQPLPEELRIARRE